MNWKTVLFFMLAVGATITESAHLLLTLFFWLFLSVAWWDVQDKHPRSDANVLVASFIMTVGRWILWLFVGVFIATLLFYGMTAHY